METKEIFEKLYTLELEPELTPSTIRNYVSNLTDNDIKQLLTIVADDGDKQYALDYNMRRALSSKSKNINSGIKHKILTILSSLDEYFQEITKEESDKDSRNKRDSNDLDSRLAVIKSMIEDNMQATDEITNKYKEFEEKYNTIDKDLIDAKSTLLLAKSDLQKASKQTENVINQSITILGIFVAIIAVFLGGFAGITMLDKISVFNTYKFYLSIVIVGHIMIDLIFMFIYMLSRIIDKSVSVNCNNYIKCNNSVSDKSTQDKCQTCCLNNMISCKIYNEQHKTDYIACTLFKRLKCKYPYVYFINAVGFVIEIGLCVAWLFDDVILYIKQFMVQNIPTTILISILCIIFIVSIISKLKNKLKD